MGCDCAKARDKSESPKNSSPVRGYLNPALPAMRRKTVMLGGPQAAQLVRRVAEIGKLYRVEAVVKDGDTEVISLAMMVNAKKHCFLKRVAKAAGLAQIQQSAVIDAELERLLRLDHPYVLYTYEAMQDDVNFYLVSQAFLGGQLKDYLADKRFTEEQASAQLMQQIFAALVCCHRQGVVHGRLSPYTVVFSEPLSTTKPRVKLTGFGSFDAIPNKVSPKDLSAYVAPEATQGYSEKCDIWSCGIILFQLISEELPFQSKRNSKIRERRRSVTFGSANWDGKSQELMAFLAILLDPNPHNRPTAAECLEHAWIKQRVSPIHVKQSTINASIYSLKKMKARNPLQLGVLKFIMHRMQDEREIENATDSFLLLDIDCDGVLSESEVKRSFMRVFSETEAFAATKKVMEAMENNSGGVISYSDFLIAFSGEKKLLSIGNMTMTFRYFDKEMTGRVSLLELRNGLAGSSSAEKDRQWRALMLQANPSPITHIDFSEFSKLVGSLE